MSYQAVVPSVHPPYTEALLASMRAFDPDRVLVVDNSVRNRGVAASWNLGVAAMRERGADWLILLSAALRFEEPYGADLLAALEEHPDAVAVEGGYGLGWHCLAWRRRVFDAVGLFDENFWPAYLEDLDFSRRVMLAGLTAHADREFWPKVPVEAYVRCFGHGQRFGGPQHRSDYGALVSYYVRKWDGPPGGERFDRPFGDGPLCWWPANRP